MTEEVKEWFIQKVAQNPEYLRSKYLPELEKFINKCQLALDNTMRTKGLEEIKYGCGVLDGARQILSVIDGLRLSEQKPAAPGLMERFFAKRES